jgi:hypothetical protein
MIRREFAKSLTSSIASYALLRSLFLKDAFAGAIKPVTDHWLQDLHEMSMDLRQGQITPVQWQSKVNELFDRVELEYLLRRIDFERLAKGFEYPDLGVHTKGVRFPALAGLPTHLAFFSKIFGMRKDRAIIPHGHRNMVSCHYVIKGDFWLRHYDKLEDGDTHMIIQPTVDKLVRVGSHSAISDERNNIHWLRAMTETAFTYDVIVVDLGDEKYEIENIDPYSSERLPNGRLRVAKLPVEEALRKYGYDTHHV